VIRLQAVLLRLAADLDALRCDWALVGGLAVAVRASPRQTRDLDVVIAVRDDREAERVVFGLRRRGYRDKDEGVLVDELTGRLWTMRLVAPGDEANGTIVDLLFASSGIEREIVDAAERIEVFAGLVVPVVRTGHLLALKVLARRPQDLMDVQAILETLDPIELDRARHALDLISRRGRDRGRDLVGELETLLQQPRELH
jgi:hypothetical protein